MGFRVPALKGARWFLWLIILWILVRGVASFFVGPRQAPAAVVQEDPAVMKAAASEAVAEREAPGAFAALFAREYLSLAPGKESERSAKLAPMVLAGRVDTSAVALSGTDLVGQTVAGTWPYRVVSTGEATWLVTVAARVSTQLTQVATDRFIYVAVPVLRGPEGFVVHDYPTVVPAPVSAGAQAPAPAGTLISDPDGQIRALLTGFFKVYATGAPTDISYFMEPGARLTGLGGSQVFGSLLEVTVRKVGEETWAEALVSMDDPVSKVTTRQRYTVQVIERDARWYVKQILQKGA